MKEDCVEDHEGSLDSFDELRQRLEEEERDRPREIIEEPLLATVRYTIEPLEWLIEFADLDQFATSLIERYGLHFDDSRMRPLFEGRTDQPPVDQMLQLTVARGDPIGFKNGMLRIDQPRRTTPIIDLSIGSESVQASVAGSTLEATWIAQQAVELFLDATGVSRSWEDFAKGIQLVGYQTTTRVHLGLNLLDLFSDQFQGFVEKELKDTDSLGAKMGSHAFDPSHQQAEKSMISVVPTVHNIGIHLSSFNKLSGRFEDCQLRFDVMARFQGGQGIITATSELDSTSHTALIRQLRAAVLEQ
jgi:hypothetical protein